MPRFNPNWDIQYLMHNAQFRYCVIKKPEPIPGEKTLMVREGCTVFEDGRWFYWRLPEPQVYSAWKDVNDWSDKFSTNPDYIVTQRLNRGKTGVIPAPVFKPREDNNWIDGNPLVVPDHVTIEMLEELTLAHLQLSDELQEGKPPQAQPA